MRNRRTASDRGWRWIAAAVLLAPALVLAAPAILRATPAVTVVVPNIWVPFSASTQSGTFEVFVQNTNSGTPQLSDFTAKVTLPSGGFSFISAGATVTHPYVFTGQTPTTSVTSTSAVATDFAASTPPPLNDGAGLMLVNYQVAGGTTGSAALTLVTTATDPLFGTVLHDQNLAAIAFTAQSGSLNVATIPATADWKGTTDGNWNTFNSLGGVTNWTTDAGGGTDTHSPPGATTDVVFTVMGGGSNLATTLGTNFSIKGLTFSSAAVNPVSIGGANMLTIGADGLTVQSGAAADSLNCAVALGTSENWSIGNAAASPLTVNGTLNVGTTTLTKSGTGTLVVAGDPTFGNSSALADNAGTLRFVVTSGTASIGTGVTATVASGATLELAGSVSALSSGSNRVAITNNSPALSAGELLVSGTNQLVGTINGTGDIVVNAGSDLTASQVRQNFLTINGTASSFGKVTIAQSGPGGSNPVNNTALSGTLNMLTIANDNAALGSRTYRGTLDINNNGLVIPYTAGNSPLASIEDMVRAAYNGDTFTGRGLTSSVAAHTAGLNIAVADNAQLQTPYTTFEGQTVSTNSILVRMTYMDDLTLSGVVTQNDAIIFGTDYDDGATSGHYWWQGDLNHDGKIDQNDAILFGANFNTSLPALDGNGGGLELFSNALAANLLGGNLSTVPEPATLLLALAGLIGVWRLTRRLV